MIKRYTQEEFDLAKSNDLLPLECEYCHKIFYKAKKHIKSDEKLGKSNKGRFCSTLCGNLYKGKTYKVICENCNKEYYVPKKDYDKSSHHFCSLSCSAHYNNTHKQYGTKRSKLEAWLEDQLIKLYPNLTILFNDKSTINSELDIYIPSLHLAFELNGIFHYEPIFGVEKLTKIQNNDNNKFQLCQENKISLCIIDTSSQHRFSENSSKKFLKIIKEIIDVNLQ